MSQDSSKALQEKTQQEEKCAELERWFSEEHDRLYKQRDDFVKTHEGSFYTAILESAMGQHDLVWTKWLGFLYDMGYSVDMIHSWREKKNE